MIEEATLVRVTREHIARGQPRDCETCPVALAIIGALGDLLPEGSLVDVDPMFAYACLPDGETWIATMPAVATNFIVALDDLGDRGSPFGFTLTWRLTDDRRWEE